MSHATDLRLAQRRTKSPTATVGYNSCTSYPRLYMKYMGKTMSMQIMNVNQMYSVIENYDSDKYHLILEKCPDHVSKEQVSISLDWIQDCWRESLTRLFPRTCGRPTPMATLQTIISYISDRKCRLVERTDLRRLRSIARRPNPPIFRAQIRLFRRLSLSLTSIRGF